MSPHLLSQFERAKDNQNYNFIYLNAKEILQVHEYQKTLFKRENLRVVVKVFDLDNSKWVNLDPVNGITDEGGGGGGSSDHNALTNLQGGSAGQYYHFTNAQHSKILSGNYQGDWNASTNSPAIPAASSSNKDFFYRVSTAGSTNINGVNTWKVGDWIWSTGSVWIRLATGQGAETIDSLPITSNGQTVFALSKVPENMNTSKLEVNGAKQRYGIDYTIAGTVLTWISTSFTLRTSDILELYYF